MHLPVTCHRFHTGVFFQIRYKYVYPERVLHLPLNYVFEKCKIIGSRVVSTPWIVRNCQDTAQPRKQGRVLKACNNVVAKRLPASWRIWKRRELWCVFGTTNTEFWKHFCCSTKLERAKIENSGEGLVPPSARQGASAFCSTTVLRISCSGFIALSSICSVLICSTNTPFFSSKVETSPHRSRSLLLVLLRSWPSRSRSKIVSDKVWEWMPEQSCFPLLKRSLVVLPTVRARRRNEENKPHDPEKGSRNCRFTQDGIGVTVSILDKVGLWKHKSFSITSVTTILKLNTASAKNHDSERCALVWTLEEEKKSVWRNWCNGRGE